MHMSEAPAYAELRCRSNFSFLTGASHPEELVARAAELGYRALAIADECSVAGVVRAHAEAKERGLHLIIGSHFVLDDGLELTVLARDRDGYTQLCRLITIGRRAAEKGSYHLTRDDLLDQGLQRLDHCSLLWVPGELDSAQEVWLAERFRGRLWIAVELLGTGHDRRRERELCELGRTLRLPCVAAGDVHMHRLGRRALQDTLTAIRIGRPVAACGAALFPNGERHLRPIEQLSKHYPADLLEETLRVAQDCRFSLDELRYEYPQELVPEGHTPTTWLRHLTEEGATRRWPGGMPVAVRVQVEHELLLIADLNYEPFFLTVHDVVAFARERGILCQGRGSAANSAVCYCLGITEVDPARMVMLFERFISRERDEPPDIDVDFEHERREEVIQYIYAKYGRHRAALAATVITYRPRSAVRDVGKALGLDPDQLERLAQSRQWWDGGEDADERIREAGFDPANPTIHRLKCLVDQLLRFPRHLSQHVGGFVIAADDLERLVPVENAAMADRTVIQWDKEDLEELGLLKVDVLALGMLTAIHRCFDLVEDHRGERLTLASVPAEDPAVYDMICHADTVGVFQIESRAQMAMLPRLRPRCYYDLVIEIALIRPGPIQGDMVHPYLRRRHGEEAISYPSPAVEAVLERTLGVPIFQEQVMQIAMVAAGFSPGEADQLRRSMAAWRRSGDLTQFHGRLVSGMSERGYTLEFAERIYEQLKGFGSYGFPESHAASFALLVYVSSWLKHHEPAAFCAALLNSQPMGFYAPAQLVADARRNGVDVLPADVGSSEWECHLDSPRCLRLGLSQVKGLDQESAERIVAARGFRAFGSVDELVRRTRLGAKTLSTLAAAGALKSIAGHRHRANWAVTGVEDHTESVGALLADAPMIEGTPMLRTPTEGEDIIADYAHIGLTLGRHPMAVLRERLDRHQVVSSQELSSVPDGTRLRVAGLVMTKQRPGTAAGVTFVTLEDEHGSVNLVIWRQIADRDRRALLGARLLGAVGRLQREGEVIHVIVDHLEDHSQLLGKLLTRSRNFH
jgi:error-prone DNA polymerase